MDMSHIRNSLFGLSSEVSDVFSVLHGDPGFIDAAGRDYHLAAESPVVHAGISYAGIGTDLDKRPFATLPSLGCYEYSRPGLRILLQ